MRGSEHIAYYAGEFSGVAGMERVDEESKILAETRLRNMLDELAAGSKVQPRIVTGDPVSEIIQHAEAEDIDLIVMATHGRRGLSRLLMGSVTEQVVRCAPCPVLSIRAKAHQLSSLRFSGEDVAMN
jgi:nucleotide-binding universal stress UspA family protein